MEALSPSLNKARAELAALASEYELNVDPDAIIEDIGIECNNGLKY